MTSPVCLCLSPPLGRALEADGGMGGFGTLVEAETAKGWHTTVFRLFWRWRSRPGRPPVSSAMQALIRRLSRKNPLRGGGPIGIENWPPWIGEIG